MCYSSNVMISCCRCFTFGIGSGASSALVRGIARASNGSAEFIADSEQMQSKVCSLYKFKIHVMLCIKFRYLVLSRKLCNHQQIM